MIYSAFYEALQSTHLSWFIRIVTLSFDCAIQSLASSFLHAPSTISAIEAPPSIVPTDTSTPTSAYIISPAIRDMKIP